MSRVFVGDGLFIGALNGIAVVGNFCESASAILFVAGVNDALAVFSPSTRLPAFCWLVSDIAACIVRAGSVLPDGMSVYGIENMK